MLKLFDIGIDNAIAFTISGKVTQEDMSLALDSLREKIDKYDDVVILEKIESLDGVEFLAIIEEIKYFFEYGISNISKIAILTDKEWLEKAVDIEDTLFKNIDMRAFHFEEEDKAVEFLRTKLE